MPKIYKKTALRKFRARGRQRRSHLTFDILTLYDDVARASSQRHSAKPSLSKQRSYDQLQPNCGALHVLMLPLDHNSPIPHSITRPCQRFYHVSSIHTTDILALASILHYSINAND